MSIQSIRDEISTHPSNEWARKQGYEPIFQASKTARINIIGQAPGIRAQESGVPWDDISGKNLREWLGLSDEQFYDESLIALTPMDFYFPGKGKSGDLPPRKDFAPLWHPKVLAALEDIQLTILIGQYAQKYYLQKSMKRNLTETVRSYEEYLPEFLPIVHPSPLTARWQAKNPWFKQTFLPNAKDMVATIIGK